MELINLTRAELAWLRLTIAAKQSENHHWPINLALLYGKINMLYNEACKEDRATPTHG